MPILCRCPWDFKGDSGLRAGFVTRMTLDLVDLEAFSDVQK